MPVTYSPRTDSAVEVPRFTVANLNEETHHLLLWQAKGHTRFVVDGRPLTLTAGQALWIPARTDHRFTIAPNSALMPMFFDARAMTSIVDVPTLVPIDANAETLCLALIGSQYSLLRPPADLQQMVVAVVEAQAVAPVGIPMPRSLTALRVARNVVLNPADQRSLADWAAELHISTRSLERAFVAETGLSWRRWRRIHRMIRAAHLLAAGSSSVVDVAGRVGFHTPSAFTRAFREHHGITPTDYRAAAIRNTA